MMEDFIYSLFAFLLYLMVLMLLNLLYSKIRDKITALCLSLELHAANSCVRRKQEVDYLSFPADR